MTPCSCYNQNGCREGRSTTDHILALRRILDECKKNNLSVVVTVIDLKKAFDSMNRRSMFMILEAYDIPFAFFLSVCTNTCARVVTPDGISDQFEISSGVLQCDTLAPFIIIIVLDHALRKAIDGREAELGLTILPRCSRRSPAISLTELNYADDIALLFDSMTQAQTSLDLVLRH